MFGQIRIQGRSVCSIWLMYLLISFWSMPLALSASFVSPDRLKEAAFPFILCPSHYSDAPILQLPPRTRSSAERPYAMILTFTCISFRLPRMLFFSPGCCISTCKTQPTCISAKPSPNHPFLFKFLFPKHFAHYFTTLFCSIISSFVSIPAQCPPFTCLVTLRLRAWTTSNPFCIPWDWHVAWHMVGTHETS